MTLARELEDLEARRKAGTLSDEDASRAKEALLRGASGTAARDTLGDRDTAHRGTLRHVIFAGAMSNLLMTIVVLATLAAMVYVFIPLTLAMPIMIVLALCLPFIWLWDWFTDLF
ncbi:hypothetical protein [Tropicimonas sp. S265A]|uniref:hypothetical protein n=1 Tax=Tropicimonas sp. S265A TaxID=3415134 RepID=UPI003C7DD083